jgi:hypothetical protein
VTSSRARYERTRHAIVTLLPTIDGLAAEGFVSDLADELREVNGVVGRVRVAKTPDPQRRFEARTAFSGSAATFGRRLVRAFNARLALPGGRAHALTVDENEVRLEFVTWVAGQHHATGRVMAIRGR